MITDTEGIVLRQVKALGGRRMILLFSKKFGKISVGTSINEGGRNKSALSVRAFTYGRYELFKNRDSYNLNSGQVLKSYYGLGEDLDKYMAASYILELTEKVLPEELPQPRIFALLLDFMSLLERRPKKHGTLVLAYLVKLLDALGTMPELDRCTCCGKETGGCNTQGEDKTAGSSEQEDDKVPKGKIFFSIEEGGIICSKCAKEKSKEGQRPLIYQEEIGIIDILKYFQKRPMSSFEKLVLDESIETKLQTLMREYISYHIDIGSLKSESFFQI